MKIFIVVLLSTLKLLQKSDRSTENGITFPDAVKNSSAIPVAIGITVLIDEQHNSKIFLNPYNLWDVVPAALMSLNINNDRYSMSNQYPQPTTHPARTDSNPEFFSLRRMDSQRKGLRVSFAFFQQKIPTRPKSERNSCYGWRVEWSLEFRSDGWSSAICDELYLYLSVAICFTCLVSIVCLCNICCFFRNFLFLLTLMTLSEK